MKNEESFFWHAVRRGTNTMYILFAWWAEREEARMGGMSTSPLMANFPPTARKLAAAKKVSRGVGAFYVNL